MGNSSSNKNNSQTENGSSIGTVIHRLAIDSSADIGSLYDANNDQLLNIPNLQIPHASVTPRETENKPVVKFDRLEGKSLSTIIGIDKELCLNVYLNIVNSKGISSLLKYLFVIDRYTRFLSYYYRTKQKNFIEEQPFNKSKTAPKSLINTNATHVVTNIEYGIHAIIIFQLSPQYEDKLDSLLKIIENQLLTNTFRIESHQENLFQYFTAINIFSNIVDISERMGLTKILETITALRSNVDKHSPLKYTLYPIRCFFQSYPNDKGIYYSLKQNYIDEILTYLDELSLLRKSLKIPVDSQQEKVFQKYLKEQFSEIKQNKSETEDLYQSRRIAIAGLIRKNHNENMKQEAFNPSLIDDKLKELLVQTRETNNRWMALKEKPRLIRNLEKYGIEYLNVKSVVKDDDHNWETVSEQLVKDNSQKHIFCFDDKLAEPSSSEWKKSYDRIMNAKQNKPQLEVIYADFSYCSSHPKLTEILPMGHAYKKQQLSPVNNSSTTAAASIPPEISAPSKPVVSTSQPAPSASQSTPSNSKAKQSPTDPPPKTENSTSKTSKPTASAQKPATSSSSASGSNAKVAASNGKSTSTNSKGTPSVAESTTANSKSTSCSAQNKSSISKSQKPTSQSTTSTSKTKSTTTEAPAPPPKPTNDEQPISQPIKYMNVLLLGASGVGKSTFVNAIVNYLNFETLEEAVSEKPIVVMPVSFLLTAGHNFDENIVRFGEEDPNENHNNVGQSVTQQCKSYVFTIGTRTKLRLIDTPGMGDTRGLEQDDRNMHHILSFINNLPHLNAICILLKPNESKLNVVFRTYFTRLIGFLGENVRNNIVFCFTNTRSTFFAPGDTGPVLRKMLNEHSIQNIPFMKTNVFCFDNESFRYLVALLDGIEFDDYQKEEYKQSWTKSVDESNRLLEYISKNLKPYSQEQWQSTEHAHFQITQLTRPMLESLRNTMRNTILLEKKFSKSLIELKPAFVCKNATKCLKCRSLKRVGEFWIIVDEVHTFSNRCKRCSCDLQQHLTIDYVLEYSIWSNESSTAFQQMQNNLDGLKQMIMEFIPILKDVIHISKEHDPISCGLGRMIEEENYICKQKGTNNINSQLSNELKKIKKEYENVWTSPAANQNIMTLSDIYKQIQGVIDRSASIKKQLDAIKETQKRQMEEDEKRL